ncbi:hypothetical protein EV201_3306 [Ancylomarina subtilis]|uniref:Uncharacterized protein n=1 Tax=Ancylomarina subtilis TaxID=1639035 RepID=A0A4Q7V4F6_9BACT|nr:DUF6515 family protein [Ancylomarina subtilis]RZT91095.1 hypothetical protein EV201_3306 [Ancylomarina subtilis]
MRRSILKKLVAGTVLVTAIIFSGLPTFAQHRSHQDERGRHEKSKYTKRTKENKHDNKRNYHAKSHKKDRHQDKQYSKVRTRHYDGDHYHNDRIVRHRHHDRYDRHVHQGHNHHKHAVRRYYKHHGHRCYAHPRYGDVVVRFSVRPTIINHCDGDFYYARGRYYQYYPEVGYVRVEAPESVCFDHIPDACERVSYRGGIYFRLGDLSFVKDGRGFRLAGSIEL